MKIYFLSDKPCTLTVDGEFHGRVDGFARFLDLALCDNRFVCFHPENAVPIGFFLDARIFQTPPVGCEVYRFPDGVAVYARAFTPLNLALHVTTQERFDDILATVFAQGAPVLALNTPSGLFTADLSPAFISCTLSYHAGLFFLQAQTNLAVFDKQAKLLFQDRIQSYCIDGETLYAERIFCGRVQSCVYALSETGVRLLDIQEPTPPSNTPLYFLERLISGQDCKDFLAPDLAERADKLGAFLGNFVLALPTDEPERFLLFYKRSERVFDGEYIWISSENEKIADIRKV